MGKGQKLYKRAKELIPGGKHASIQTPRNVLTFTMA